MGSNLTSVSQSTKDTLETKYGMEWCRTPENRAFVGARQQCESPRHPYYRNVGARGIRFLYKDLDEMLTDIGFRPSPNHVLERIDRDKHYEPGNVAWTLRALVSQKSRPITQAERTVDTMMVRIIQTLARQPNKELVRGDLQHKSGSSKWGGPIFHEAVQKLAEMGYVQLLDRKETKTVLDGQKPGFTRDVTYTSAVVRLLNGPTDEL